VLTQHRQNLNGKFVSFDPFVKLVPWSTGADIFVISVRIVEFGEGILVAQVGHEVEELGGREGTHQFIIETLFKNATSHADGIGLINEMYVFE
jgi:hypothetical protein